MSSQPNIAVSVRETRDFACEAKFLLSAEQAESIRHWARRHLETDPNGQGEHWDEYCVSSVYFDTPNFDVYRRNGSYRRSKYRIRCYNSSDSAFLERKTKTKVQVSKRRTLLPMIELAHLQHETPMSWPGHWFQRRVVLRHLAPVCQISYQRMARIAQTETGPCRLTLDCALQALPCEQIIFSDLSGQLLLAPTKYIMELKFRHALPVLFRRLLMEFAPVPQRVSKYRLAIEHLGLAQPR